MRPKSSATKGSEPLQSFLIEPSIFLPGEGSQKPFSAVLSLPGIAQGEQRDAKQNQNQPISMQEVVYSSKPKTEELDSRIHISHQIDIEMKIRQGAKVRCPFYNLQ